METRRAARGRGPTRRCGCAARRCAVKPPRANPYRDRWAGQLRKDDVGSEVRVAGWVHRRRDHGGLIFIDLRDRTGLLQVVFRPEEARRGAPAGRGLRAEDVISVAGELVEREAGARQPRPADRRGRAGRARDRAARRRRDAAVRDRGGRQGGDEELRLRYRYLDLRREHMRRAFELRHDVDHGHPRLPERARASSRSRRR